MGVPKRRSSRSRQGMRRGSAAHKRPVRGVGKCPQCGGIKQPHRVCPACGYYRGRPVIMPAAQD